MGASCRTFLNVDILIYHDHSWTTCSDDDDDDDDNVDGDYLYNGGKAEGIADRSVSKTQCWISFACDDGDGDDDFIYEDDGFSEDDEDDDDGGADDNDETVKITVVMRRTLAVILAMAMVNTMMK